MTDDENHRQEPTPEDLAHAAKIGDDLVLALRWLSSLNDGNRPGMAAAMADTVRSGRGTEVTTAVMFMTMDLGRELFGVDGFAQWLGQQLANAADVKDHQDGLGDGDAGSPPKSL